MFVSAPLVGPARPALPEAVRAGRRAGAARCGSRGSGCACLPRSPAAPRSDRPDPEALLRPDDGRLLILVLFAVGWLAWAAFTASASLEFVAVARGIPAPTLPGIGPVQRTAAGLVAATALLVVVPPVSNQAGAVETVSPPMAATSVSMADTAPSVNTRDVARPLDEDPGRPHPTVTVRRHDTLWSLAERHLGDGARYTEILALNRGTPQPDGRHLDNPSWLYPGWVLRLPADARAVDFHDASHRHDVVVVESGDTLWEIAEDELGDEPVPRGVRGERRCCADRRSSAD